MAKYRSGIHGGRSDNQTHLQFVELSSLLDLEEDLVVVGRDNLDVEGVSYVSVVVSVMIEVFEVHG